ncbi:MAG TPA: GNAT family N-acetyltransferase [Solirubrobacteraceae bacterium]|nr:GNAT family N-acetyltransferase [Solirubrobacteraceae bacterium]
MRVAVLGQGSIGRRHARLLHELGHEVTVFDPAGVTEGLAPAVQVAASAQAALAAADAALVATPTALHPAHAREALQAGLPTLVEKPLATCAADARELERLAAERGLALGVAMNLRFHPGPATVRRLVQAGEIGTVLRASVTFGSWLPGWRPGVDYRTTYSARAELGGGILLDAIHELDYLTWVLGPVARVSASLRQLSDLQLAGVEDVATLDLELACGAQATVTLDYLDREYHRGCRIVGSEATLQWDWASEQVACTLAGGERVLHPAPNDIDATYRDELADFVCAVQAGRRPATDASAARRTLEVVDAARESAATGRVVDVASPASAGARDLRLRHATTLDRDLLRAWRNDPATVAASFQQAPVPAADHAAWLERRLADPGCRLWIVEHDGLPAGQVRAERAADGDAEIHIALAPSRRGRGLASATLRLAVQQARRELAVGSVVARVKADNAASLRAFAGAGFRVERRSDAEVALRHGG